MERNINVVWEGWKNDSRVSVKLIVFSACFNALGGKKANELATLKLSG